MCQSKKRKMNAGPGDQSGYERRRYADWRRYPNGERYRPGPGDGPPAAPDDPTGGPTGDPMGPDAAGPDDSWTAPGRVPTRNSGLVLAVLVIAVGVLFFLSNLGLFRIHDIFSFWPIILILIGLSRVSGRQGKQGNLQAAAFLLCGGIFLLSNLGLFSLSGRTVWPLVLIGAGILMLSKTMGDWDHGRRFDRSVSPSAMADPDSVLQEWAVFGGVKRIIDSPDFQGGQLMSIFGGIEIDLRRAQIAQRDRPVVLDASAAFGGVNVKVPDNWRVAVRGVGIFGGYEDKTLRANRADRSAPQLLITGYAAFGGVVIE